MTKITPPDPEGMNDRRAYWAGEALKTFRHITGTDHECCVADLICDLQHWCDRNDVDFNNEVRLAASHYRYEVEGVEVQ
jgi:hypothetical protein